MTKAFRLSQAGLLFFLVCLLQLALLNAWQENPLLELVQTKARQASVTQDDFAQLIDQVSAARDFFLTHPQELLTDGDLLDTATSWNTNVSEACSDDVQLIVQHVRTRDMWALQFADAAGKPEAGVLQGNFDWLGSFGQCRTAAAALNNETAFRGKYCLPSIGPKRNDSTPAPQNPEGPSISLALRIGVCFPDSCTDADTLQLMSNLLTIVSERANISGLEVYGSACQPKGFDYDFKAIIALSVIGFFFFVLALGTLYDLVLYQPRLAEMQSDVTIIDVRTSYPPIGTATADATYNAQVHPQANDEARVDQENTEDDDAPLLQNHSDAAVKEKKRVVTKGITPEVGILGEVLLVFSVYTNLKKLFNTTQSDQSLSCIHGIRFFSMTWVVLGHTYLFTFYVLRDLTEISGFFGNFFFQAIANATVAVDSFFAMSGLLVCYLFVLNYQKTKKFPMLTYYIHRYWRLTAIYVIVMVVYLFLFKYLNSGPQWQPNGMEVDGCRDTWWTNLLYVNNLVYTDRECMGWTWYLANDMQFYWISPIILIPLVKVPRVGMAILAALFVAHIVATAVVSVQNNFPPSLLGGGLSVNTTNSFGNYFDGYYIKPWTRIGPYLIGMMFGYLLVKFRTKKLKLRKDVAMALWAVATAIALAVVYGLYGANNGHDLSPTAAAIYNTLHRNGWALAVCWVIFACVQGYGGFVNRILSWHVLVPLSRLTYCCYLIHIPILLVFYLGKTSTIDFSHLEIVYYFLGTLMITYAFALLFAVGCEAPLLALEKLVTRPRTKSSKK